MGELSCCGHWCVWTDGYEVDDDGTILLMLVMINQGDGRTQSLWSLVCLDR